MPASRAFGSEGMKARQHLFAEELQAAHHVGVRHTRDRELDDEVIAALAVTVAELLLDRGDPLLGTSEDALLA